MPVATQKDVWLNKTYRRLELLRGRLARWRGAHAGARFGLGPGLVLLYPSAFYAGDDVTIEGPGYLHCLSGRGVRIGTGTSFARNLWLHCGGTFEDYDHGYFEIGEHSFIGPNAVMGAGGGITIGSHVLMGPDIVISSENHHFDDPQVRISDQGVFHRGVVIEDDVWIASKAVILDGVTVGHGSVIAAGAVVTRSVPPYSIVAGVPARVLRRRGEKNVVQVE
jgi:carbonic anhydrase/acetyltransferase-like protein (isoleucine patch superfamily)